MIISVILKFQRVPQVATHFKWLDPLQVSSHREAFSWPLSHLALSLGGPVASFRLIVSATSRLSLFLLSRPNRSFSLTQFVFSKQRQQNAAAGPSELLFRCVTHVFSCVCDRQGGASQSAGGGRHSCENLLLPQLCSVFSLHAWHGSMSPFRGSAHKEAPRGSPEERSQRGSFSR